MLDRMYHLFRDTFYIALILFALFSFFSLGMYVLGLIMGVTE